MSRIRLTIKIERLHQNGGVAQKAEVKHVVQAERITDPANPSHNAVAAQIMHKIAEGTRSISVAAADVRDLQMQGEVNGA